MTRPTGVMWVLVPAVGCWIGWLEADAVFWVCLYIESLGSNDAVISQICGHILNCFAS